MLLWACIMAGYGAALGRGGSLPEIRAAAQAVISTLLAGVVLFILLTSNPFVRLFPVPVGGAELNPLLQDLGMALHPPVLYLGYVGFAVPFSLSIAALMHRQCGRALAHVMQPWILFAQAWLTLGVGLGSWWAYRELGWGGFWFWDPVENVSLLPWFAGTALLHSNMVLARRGALRQWVPLLAILTFAMSLIGTFLVRSGLVTSVHSFASDPTRGLYVLFYILFTVGGGLLVYTRNGGDGAAPPAPLFSRAGMILLNNLFFIALTVTLLLGTIYPMAVELAGGPPLSVGAPYFNRVMLPLMALALVMAAAAPLAGWTRVDWPRLRARLAPAGISALAGAFVVLALADRRLALGVTGMSLAGWLIGGTLVYLLPRLRHRQARADTLAAGLAHLGAGVLVAGVTAASLWRQELDVSVRPGMRFDFAGTRLTYAREWEKERGNHLVLLGKVEEEKTPGAALIPEYRRYPVSGTGVSIASIRSRPWADWYAVIGEPEAAGTPLRLYRNPMMQWIWTGCILMAAGGLTGALERWRKTK
ncbi:MAG: heme lyase CcmF/NrfE family subunit [Alphaproteobacteria bacterium]|nr:heme lyase CcmF/NrfE family subunit [Alphaproteobacteria bacterium]